MNKHVIVFNAGSSSLKFSLFTINDLSLILHGIVEDINNSPQLIVKNSINKTIFNLKYLKTGYKSAISTTLNWIESLSDEINIIAAGHRVVHGGIELSSPTKITPTIVNKLKKIVKLAPLHLPHNISVIEEFNYQYPNIPQTACFDTAFHITQIEEEKVFALPKSYADEGIISYGFHGLSYEYIASVLPNYAGRKANKKVITCHLGNGASMCAMKNLKSIATTMSFTPLDGLMMGTRCGNIDPGVILYLMEEKNMSIKEVKDLLYNNSGLKGFSNISNDMRKLINSKNPQAKKTVNLFCYTAAKHLSSLISTIGGLDVIVFTAGVGEGSATIRKKICDRLKWAGATICNTANLKNHTEISSKNSKIKIYVIPTNEELVIARSTYK